MITNNDPNMASAMLCAQEVIAVALDRLFRNAIESKNNATFSDGMWAIIRIHLPDIYGSTDFKITLHGPYHTEMAAMRSSRMLQGQSFIIGPVKQERS